MAVNVKTFVKVEVGTAYGSIICHNEAQHGSGSSSTNT